jgi:hypothetical protein
MWCVGRRSEKIKKELERCIENVISAIKKLLEDAGEKGITEVQSRRIK